MRHLGTGKEYALKAIRKDLIIENNCVNSTLLELKILQMANHPNLCHLERFFQSEERIYFVTSYIRGKNLYELPKQL